MQIQLRTSTWLQGRKLPYRDIILFVYCWCYELTSIKFCERELSLSAPTIVDYNNYLREVCAASLLRNPIQIGGAGEVVEIDESLMLTEWKTNSGFWAGFHEQIMNAPM